MSSSRHCTSCGTELETADRFCPSCGREAGKANQSGSPKTCPLCGQANSAEAPTCSSCGAKLGQIGQVGKDTRRSPGGPRKGDRVRGTAPTFLQSWKFSAGVALVLAACLILFVMTRPGPEPVSAQPDPHDAGMMKELTELQARIDADPNDGEAVLQMANRLYDVQFFDRAAVMYERYLTINPGNLDARVDLGTSYFQMSFSDSARHESLQKLAEESFLTAIRADPGHQLANFNLGIVHLHRGDMAGATEWFEKCVKIDPGSEAARRAKELLSQHLQNNPS